MGFLYKAIQFIILVGITLGSLLLSFHFFGLISPDIYIYFLRTLYQNYLAGVITLVVFFLGILSLLPYFLRTEPRNTMVRDGKTGAIRVSLDAVEGLIYRFVSRQEGVKEVKTFIKPVEGGLFIRLKLGVSPHQEIPDLVTEIQESLQDYVNQVVGVKVEKIETVVHSIESEERDTFDRKREKAKREKVEKEIAEKDEKEKEKEKEIEKEIEKAEEQILEEETEEKWYGEETTEEETEERKQDKDF